MDKSKKQYVQLSAEERATIMLMRQEDKGGVRELGRILKRAPGTISREINRDLESESG